MDMEIRLTSHNSRQAVRVKLLGMISPGSEGNVAVVEATRKMNALLEDVFTRNGVGNSGPVGLILDFSDLAYSFGDAIATLWLKPMEKGVRCVLVANGSTRRSLETLIARSLPVPVVETETDAWGFLP